MRLVGNHQIKIRRREKRLVLVVEQQGLNRADHDLRAAPVLPPHLVNHRVKIVGEQVLKHFCGLVFQFQPVDQKQHAPRISSAEKQLDKRSRDERLARAGRHFQEKAIRALPHGALHGANGPHLIRPQKAQAACSDEPLALIGVSPRRLHRVIGPLRPRDIVIANALVDETLRMGHDLPVASHRIRRGKRCDDVRIAPVQIPKVVQVAVGQNDEPAVQGTRVPSGLLLADQWIFVFGLGF